MKIKYKDKEIEVKRGATPLDIAGELELDSKEFLAAKINGKAVDMSRPIDEEGEIIFLDFGSEDGKRVFWHSSAHIMATAVKRLYPDVLLGIGPSIDEGFYYDFYNLKVGDNDLEKIEKEMKNVVKENSRFVRRDVDKKGAEEAVNGNKFKLELLKDITDGPSVYQNREFSDLCRGPHIPSTGRVKAVKLLKVAGAYWRGDSKREVMTRIYGVSFPTKEQMEEYLKTVGERRDRNQKKIGRELELFTTSDISPGSIFFLPAGAVVYNELVKLSREMDKKYDYQEIITPQIAKADMWKISGHWDKYRDDMFKVMPFATEEEYGLKPMNCPFSTYVFKSKPRSYKDLPLRLADYGFLHRYEMEGTLDGLMRTRMFEQSDSHTYLTEEQVEGEIVSIIEITKEIYAIFGLKWLMKIGTRPEKRIGTDEEWDRGEAVLKRVLEKKGYDYEVKEGDGAFYGPKIDMYALDFTGKPDSAYAVSTIQLDFNLAKRFDVKYTGSDNAEHNPLVIHKSLMGSIGRFMGIILENSRGELPMWLAPVQVRVLTITDRNDEYAKAVFSRLKGAGIRAELDDSNNTLDYKVREAQLKKVPYVVVVGDKESSEKNIAVRDRSGKTKYKVELDAFIEEKSAEIKERKPYK